MASVPHKLKSEGKKTVHIESGFGYQITVKARYYRRNCDRKKKKGKKGLYPGLAQLGIYERSTPLLAATVAMFVAILGSFAEAEAVLEAQGIELGSKPIRRIAYRCGQRARLVQQMTTVLAESDIPEAGRRIVASCDGGRIRLREKKRGRKTKKGRTRYTAAWREPKLLIIYLVDEQGKKCLEMVPIIDGTLSGPESVFCLLLNYLQTLGIREDDKLLFIADGARWIWKRVPQLITALSLNSQQVFLLVDFFHAVQHLNKVAQLCASWTPKRRKQWVTTQRHRLRNGDVAQVITTISQLCHGRNSRAIRTELNYFKTHRHHMAYQTVAAENFPIGSGAVESAIRRVINLRLKGPAIFWCKARAEELLMLRSFYKAGRWQQFKQMAFSPSAAPLLLA